MTNETRNWHEAKPKWVVDAAEAEMAAMKRKLALRWPDEARPKRVDFSWGGYDTLRGEPIEGTYWVFANGFASRLEIRKKRDDEPGYKNWMFKINNGSWTNNVTRGKLFNTEREARVEALWEACDDFALKLETLWSALK